MLEAFRDSFPKGVMNTLYGRGGNVVPALMELGKIRNVLTLIDRISRVANDLKKMHPEVIACGHIGFGCQNAAIILADAIELAVKELSWALRPSMASAGNGHQNYFGTPAHCEEIDKNLRKPSQIAS